jgi:uncharacterized protein YegP (UPF0339 family)
MSRFQVYEDHDGQWRWRLKARNGEVVAQGESYTRREDAVRGVLDAKTAFAVDEIHNLGQIEGEGDPVAASQHRWNPDHGEDNLYDPPKFLVFKGWKDPPEQIGQDGEFYFVLRPERDKEGWHALQEYANQVEYRSPNMAKELREKLADIERDQRSRQR